MDNANCDMNGRSVDLVEDVVCSQPGGRGRGFSRDFSTSMGTAAPAPVPVGAATKSSSHDKEPRDEVLSIARDKKSRCDGQEIQA